MASLDIETALCDIKKQIADIEERFKAVRQTYEHGMCDIEDLLCAAHDKRAELMAKREGIEIGTILRLTRPVRWRGKMQDNLRVRVERITAPYGDAEPWIAAVRPATKAGWSKVDWLHIKPSWAVIE